MALSTTINIPSTITIRAEGFAATENWIPLIIENFIHGKSIKEKQTIQYGLKMARYYSECFI